MSESIKTSETAERLPEKTAGMTKLDSRKQAVQDEIRGMSDDQIRYQVAAHERHTDYGWTFDLYLIEYQRRGHSL